MTTENAQARERDISRWYLLLRRLGLRPVAAWRTAMRWQSKS